MFGIGMPELILILAVALIVIGPKKLPDLARTLGKTFREFKKATQEFRETIEVDPDLSNLKKAFNEIDSDVKTAVDLEILNTQNDQSLSDDVTRDSDNKKNDADKKEEKGPVDDS
jgi:Tat protein translocase TatB subunit